MRPPSRFDKPRAGKSLVEMLVMMSVLSVVLATVTTTLIGLFKTDRQLRRDLMQQTSLARLSSLFRADAHAAASVRIDAGCELTLADGRVVAWSFAAPRMAREVRRGEAVLHRDSFVLTDAATAGFDQPAVASGRLVRLTISAAENSDKPNLTAVRPASIEAVVGLEAQP